MLQSRQQTLRAYCPQIYTVIIVVQPKIFLFSNHTFFGQCTLYYITVTSRYTEALKLHCFLKKNPIQYIGINLTKHGFAIHGFFLEPKSAYLEALLYLIGNFISKKVYMNPNSQFLTTLLFGLNTYFFKLLHGRLFKLYFISRFIDILR